METLYIDENPNNLYYFHIFINHQTFLINSIIYIVHYFLSHIHDKHCIFASILLIPYKKFHISTN